MYRNFAVVFYVFLNVTRRYITAFSSLFFFKSKNSTQLGVRAQFLHKRLLMHIAQGIWKKYLKSLMSLYA